MITADDELTTVLAERTGLNRDTLFGHVAGARIQGKLSYPLNDAAAEDVVRRIIEDLTRVVPVGSPAEAEPASRYVWLHEMTAHYARLHDTTIRQHWERARKVSATGGTVTLDPSGPLAEAAWAKQRLGRATQALPNGYCQLPLVKTCPHANACLTCPMFITTAEFLPHHHAQRQATIQLITAAEAAGHARVAEMNKQVAANLDKIIKALEADDDSESSGQEAAAGAR